MSKKHKISIYIAIIVLIALSSYVAIRKQSSRIALEVTSEPNPLYGTRWKLVAIESEARTLNIPEENEFFVRFHSDSFIFTGGCNSIGGDYILENNHIIVTFAEQTLVDCSHLGPNVNEIETLFSDAMPTFISYDLNEDDLRIHYDDGEIFLERSSY